jgi:hypothetical protein
MGEQVCEREVEIRCRWRTRSAGRGMQVSVMTRDGRVMVEWQNRLIRKPLFEWTLMTRIENRGLSDADREMSRDCPAIRGIL